MSETSELTEKEWIEAKKFITAKGQLLLNKATDSVYRDLETTQDEFEKKKIAVCYLEFALNFAHFLFPVLSKKEAKIAFAEFRKNLINTMRLEENER